MARCDKGSFTVLPSDPNAAASSRHQRPAPALQLSSEELADEVTVRTLVPESDGWYVGIEGQPHGPLSLQMLARYLESGKINPRTYLWRPGDKAWRRLGDVSGLARIASPEERPTRIPGVNDYLDSLLGSAHTEHVGPAGLSAPSSAEARSRSPSDEPAGAYIQAADYEGSDATAAAPTRHLPDPVPAAAPVLLVRRTTAVENARSAASMEEASTRVHQDLSWDENDPIDQMSGPIWDDVAGSALHDRRRSVPSSWSSDEVSAERPRAGSNEFTRATLPPPTGRPKTKAFAGVTSADRSVGRPESARGAAASEEAGDTSAAQSRGPRSIDTKLSGELDELLPAKSLRKPWGGHGGDLPHVVAPPLPAVGMGEPAPNLMLPPKPRFWTTVRLLVGVLIGTVALAATIVAVVAQRIQIDRRSVEPARRVDVTARPRDTERHTQATSPGRKQQRKQQIAGAPTKAARPARSTRNSSPTTASASKRAMPRHPKALPKDHRLQRTKTDHALGAARARRAPSAKTPELVTAPGGADSERSQSAVVDVDALVAPRKPPAVADADEILAAGMARESPDNDEALRHLSKADIATVMRKLRPRVQACFDQHQQPGTLRLRLTVQPYGRATAQVVGTFVGTPTAACAMGAIPRLRFPQFAGDEPVRFTYAYDLK